MKPDKAFEENKARWKELKQGIRSAIRGHGMSMAARIKENLKVFIFTLKTKGGPARR